MMCQKSPGNWTKLLQNGTTLCHIVINKKINMKKAVGSGKIKNNKFLDLMDAYQACLFTVCFLCLIKNVIKIVDSVHPMFYHKVIISFRHFVNINVN